MTASQGFYYDGKSSRRLPVSLQRNGDTLVIAGDGLLVSFPLAQLRVEPRVGNTRRAIRLPDGGQVQSDDHKALDALFPQQNRFEAWVATLERHWGYALAGLIVTAILVWYAIVHGLPVAAERVARHLPVDVEIAVGEQALAALDRTWFSPSTLAAPRQAALRQRFRAFTGDLQDGYHYRLEFRGTHTGPNAFALPGGTIVMTDAMVKLAQNDEQLLAVLAHEIGHVKGHHSMRMVMQSAGVAALVSTLAGDAVSITALAVTLPTILTQSSYSQAFENEADGYAFKHLKAHGLSPRYFAEIMQLLQKRSGEKSGRDNGFNYLSSHPATGERIQRALASQ